MRVRPLRGWRYWLWSEPRWLRRWLVWDWDEAGEVVTAYWRGQVVGSWQVVF